MPGIQLVVELDDNGTPKVSKLEDALESMGRETQKTERKWKNSFKGMSGAVDKVHRKVQSMATSVPAMLGMAGIAGSLGIAVKQGIAFNATLEATESRFETILGSATMAKQVVRDLVSFSASTPFQLTEINEAAVILESFGLSGDKNLRLVGDAAAAAQRPLTEIAMILGRIKSGAFGEAFMRLAETGLATREMLTAEGLSFDAGGSFTGSASQAIAAVSQIIETRFSGMMGRLSQTWLGQWSTMVDNWSLFIGKLARPLFERLKPRISEITETLKRWSQDGTIEVIADRFATNIDRMIGRAKSFSGALGDLVSFVDNHTNELAILMGAGLGYRIGGGWGALAGAVASVLVIIERATGKVSEFIGYWKIGVGFLNAGLVAIGDGMSWVGNLFSTFGSAIGTTFVQLGSLVGSFFSSLLEWGGNSITAIAGMFEALGDGIVAALTFHKDDASAAFGSIGQILETAWTKNMGLLSEMGRDEMSEIGKAWGEVAGAATSDGFLASWNANMAIAEQKMKDLLTKPTEAPAPTSVSGFDATGFEFIPEPQGEQPDQQGTPVGQPPTWYTDMRGQQLSEQFALEQAHAEALTQLWDNYWGDMAATVQYGFSDIIAESLLDTSGNFAEFIDQTIDSLRESFVRMTADMAVAWVAAQIKMAVASKALEKVQAGEQAAQAASHVALEQTKTQANIGTAASGAFAAYSTFPFIGAGLAAKYIALSLAGTAAAKGAALALRDGGEILGSMGIGSGDRYVARLSPGEWVIPEAPARRYGGAFMEGVRTGTLNPGANGDTWNLNVAASAAITEDDIEEHVVPILERLIEQRRFAS